MLHKIEYPNLPHELEVWWEPAKKRTIPTTRGFFRRKLPPLLYVTGFRTSLARFLYVYGLMAPFQDLTDKCYLIHLPNYYNDHGKICFGTTDLRQFNNMIDAYWNVPFDCSPLINFFQDKEIMCVGEDKTVTDLINNVIYRELNPTAAFLAAQAIV